MTKIKTIEIEAEEARYILPSRVMPSNSCKMFVDFIEIHD